MRTVLLKEEQMRAMMRKGHTPTEKEQRGNYIVCKYPSTGYKNADRFRDDLAEVLSA